MAGRLLLIVALSFSPIGSFNVIRTGALLPPELTVNPPVITETDSVTLTCVAPPSVSVSRCKFFIANEETSKRLCVETLTGTKLLDMAHKRSPAEVKVRCIYIVQIDAINSPSPESKTSTIIINNLLPPNLSVNPLVITETDPVMLDCQIPPTVSVSQCYFNIARRKPARMFSCLKTLTGTDLLSSANQSSPATVEVTCFYLISHQSPDSNMISVSIETPRPELRVNPASVTETDLVTVNCVTPPSVSVCYLYFLNTKTAKVISCLQTLTGMELLSMANQRLPAEVEVTCYYTMRQYQSPHSYMSSIWIDVKSTTTQMTTFSTTTETVSEGIDEATTDTLTSAGLPVTTTSSFPETVSKGTNESTTDTLTSALFSVTPTNSSPVSEVSNTSTTDILQSDVTCGTTTKPFLELKMLVVAVSGFGVIVGVITLGVTVVCHKRRSEKRFPRRSQVSTGDFLSMTNIDRRGSLSAGNTEAYSVISFVPAANRPTGFKRVTGRESQSENPYHVYATIPEDPPAADLKDITYSTIQPH